MSPWLSVMKPRCLRPWVGNPENFSFNTFENSVKPYLWIRGTELPRTESREGRKKASAAVCTMSRLAPRSRTWNILSFSIIFVIEQGISSQMGLTQEIQYRTVYVYIY